MKNKRTNKIIAVLLFLVMLLSITAIWNNTALEINTCTISNLNRLPSEFDGYRIMHISDLHNVTIGEDNKRLINSIKECKPDIICITGDIIDSRTTDTEVALNFAKEAVKIAPCYFVTGNHENRVQEYPQFKEELENIGVIVLDDEFTYINRAGATIKIMGINDPSFETDYASQNSSVVNSKLMKLKTDEEFYTVLLSHRPELFDVYASNQIDLVLSGHAHGGQIRLHFIGGVFSPNQGFFPEYDAGLFVRNDTNMFVSRGIGNSVFPIRINNRPEIILIELKR